MKQPVRFEGAERVYQTAKRIQYVAKQIMDACESGQTMDPYARNKAAGGGLAQDATVLAVEIIKFEMESEMPGLRRE